MKKLYFMSMCLLLVLHTIQAQNWSWLSKAGGSSVDDVKDIFVDVSGNSYLTGTFTGTATFGALGTITSSGTSDVFVAKYDASGNPVWVKKAGSSNASAESSTGIWVTASGECLITGRYKGTATFGSYSATSVGGYDIFVARYNASTGAELGVNSYGTSGDDSGAKVTSDASNNVYVAGYMASAITFSGLSAVSGNMFVMKRNSSGTNLWAKGGTLSTSGSIADIRVDNNGAFYWFGQVVGGSTPTATVGAMSAWGPQDGAAFYLFKLDASNGADGWARGGGGTDTYSSGDAMDVDVNGNVVITGRAGSAIYLGTTTATGGIYLAKLNAAGTYLYGTIVGPETYVFDLDTDCKANAYITGIFTGTYTATGLSSITSSGSYDAFALKANSSGTPRWIMKGGSSLEDDGYGIGVDGSNNVYVTGDFNSTATFGTYSATSSGAQDVFVAKIASNYVPPIVSTGTLVCTNMGSTTLTISNPQTGYTYTWYTAATGGTLLATGISYTTPILSSTTTYYIEVNSNDFCTPSRVPVTVTVNNSCCSPFQITSITGASSMTCYDFNFEYTLTLYNPGTSAISVSSINEINLPSNPVFVVTSTSPTLPISIPAGQSVSVVVNGYYQNYVSENSFSQCFNVTAGGCIYQICTNMIVTSCVGDDLDFTVNGGNIVNTTAAVNLVATTFTGTHSWSAYLIGGSGYSISGTSYSVNYAFPLPGNYLVTHTLSGHSLTKTVTVTGENTALNFTNTAVFIPFNSNYGVGNFTLEAYIKPGTLPTGTGTKATILSGLYYTGVDGIEFGINNSGKLYFQLNGTTYANTSGPSLSNGTCSHVAITRSGSTFTFYVDGTATGSFTDANSPTYTEADFLMGQSNYTGGTSNGQFNGLIEDFRIWNVARTQSQITSNRFVTLTGTESGLLGYWPIKEGTGSVINDVTSNDNDGLLDGQTWVSLSCGGARISSTLEEASDNSMVTNSAVEAFPVPFDESFSLRVKKDKAVRISIVDMLGKTVEHIAVDGRSEYLLGTTLSSGLYLVVIDFEDHTEHVKIVKR